MLNACRRNFFIVKHPKCFRTVVSIDLSEPHNWYPHSRLLKKVIICHLGPTNSGKTFQSLQALEAASTGIYCGPLRLLAWEVCEKLRSSGTLCNLLTGQEREMMEGATHTSCTIEMADLSREYACAVLDESQLIGDNHRGWAWSQALLGLRTPEIHLCGRKINLYQCSQLNN